MDTLLLENDPTVRELVQMAHREGMPVVVRDGEDECLIALTPAAFERILFDTAVLNLGDRKALRF